LKNGHRNSRCTTLELTVQHAQVRLFDVGGSRISSPGGVICAGVRTMISDESKPGPHRSFERRPCSMAFHDRDSGLLLNYVLMAVHQTFTAIQHPFPGKGNHGLPSTFILRTTPTETTAGHF
jgi:hypothetical protein